MWAVVGGVQPVTAFVQGASPFGVLQMVGNVWEMTEEQRSPSPDTFENYNKKLGFPVTAADRWYATRGLSFAYPQLQDSAIYDEALNPIRWKSPDLGFRCVKDAQ